MPTLDPTQLDLSKIALAMRIPSAFRAYDDGAYLQINVISPRLGVDRRQVGGAEIAAELVVEIHGDLLWPILVG